jgi:hypothetical protein
MPWNLIQESFLFDSKADILIILDCCHSASVIGSDYYTGDNAVDFLLASSIEGKAPLRDKYSLTCKLVTALKSPDIWKGGFHVWFLYITLLQIQNQLGRLDLLEFGGDAECGTTPILIHWISDQEKNRDIFIHRLKGEEEDEGGEDDQSDKGDNSGDDGDHCHRENESDSEDTARKGPATTKQGGLDEVVFSTELPAKTEQRQLDYTDAATNTEPELPETRYPRLRPSAADYVDTATNTERQITPRDTPLSRLQRGSEDLIPPRSLASPPPFRQLVSLQLSVPRTARKRKMGIDAQQDRQVTLNSHERTPPWLTAVATSLRGGLTGIVSGLPFTTPVDHKRNFLNDTRSPFCVLELTENIHFCDQS